MTHLSTLVQFLDNILISEGFDDSSQNGLQVESSSQDVFKIGLAVDSGLSILEKAVNAGCQMLIVHHGLFWGNSPNLSGLMGKKVRTLIEGGCSLYASHLPLDGHLEIGNNSEILRLLDAKLSATFCRCGIKDIGVVGEFEEALKVEDFESKLIHLTTSNRFLALKYGTTMIKRFGIVSGGASYVIHEAKKLGLDAFITGEPKHNVYHEAKELKMNAFFAGHYATETFGVKAVGRLLENQYGVTTEFIDEPSSI